MIRSWCKTHRSHEQLYLMLAAPNITFLKVDSKPKPVHLYETIWLQRNGLLCCYIVMNPDLSPRNPFPNKLHMIQDSNSKVDKFSSTLVSNLELGVVGSNSQQTMLAQTLLSLTTAFTCSSQAWTPSCYDKFGREKGRHIGQAWLHGIHSHTFVFLGV